MTKGIDGVTLDGISFSYFEKLAKDIISGKYQPNPIRRVEIPKANGKSRPLGISSPRDKIVQAGIACILEAI
jgi:RNA-directed DNA polymerase